MADCDNLRKISQISKNTRLGVCRLNESTFITALKEKRQSYGVSQTRLAIMAGISREHLNRIEAGKVTLTDDMQDKLMEAVEKFNPDAPMFLLFDYVRIRFPTLDIQHVIRDILKLNVDYMLHEDYGHYKYTEHYYLGDVFVYTSQDEEKGTLLELKGKGCRQFESYLLAQGRSWYDFLMDALVEGGVMKRLDLAINDRAGILDIPDLTAKCNREECVSLFRSFKSYASGELVKHNEQDKSGMGHTLYIGSLKSEVYFCCYEKNYEQYAKLGIPTSEAPIKNRFEIRLKDERAYYAVRELLTHYDAEQTAFSIINHYIRFVDREPEKRKTDWKLNDRWAWFIGKDRPPVKLTTDPEPYTLERTLGWISRQVAPTLKMLKKIDAGNSTSYLKEIEDNAKLTEKHLQIIRQQTADTEELITE
ncbi:XRE family transcriptional regulator [Enterococcus faecalis]|uniref:MobT family relaxase n=1 Tax=Clostridioides difficile TaxID=1496 RepID=UPI002350C80E|nr:MobT family relaxase [Clostridioides difficile]EKR9257712.1 XRE family transcriptional regulator [Enterococcus faecalis]